jgi:uncharacterized Fe-S cluster protein YjdI
VIIDPRDVPVFYISMDDNTAQHNYVEGWLAKHGFKSVTRLPGVKADTKRMGVALAHKNALEHCLKAVEGHFIVFEGDVAPWVIPETLNIPDDADAVYLGASKWGLKDGHGVKNIAVEPYSEEVLRIRNMLAAHGVLYTSSKYVQFLIRAIDVMIDMGTNQDKARAETQKYWKIYGVAQPLIYQTGTYLQDTKIVLPGPTNKPLSWFYR